MTRRLLAAVLAGSLVLAGAACGKKGALEPPPDETRQDQPRRGA